MCHRILELFKLERNLKGHLVQPASPTPLLHSQVMLEVGCRVMDLGLCYLLVADVGSVALCQLMGAGCSNPCEARWEAARVRSPIHSKGMPRGGGGVVVRAQHPTVPDGETLSIPSASGIPTPSHLAEL